MKLHRNLVLAVIEGLKAILLQQKHADMMVSFLLGSNKSWGTRDRNFIAENIYNIVRYKRVFEFCAEEEIWSEASLWKIFGAKLILENYSLPEWNEFVELNSEKIIERNDEAKSIRRIRESIPDWLDELGEKELRENWGKEVTALNSPAKFCLRINTLKTNKTVIKTLLSGEEIEFSETDLAPDALIISSKKNFRNHPTYKNGLLEVQDVSSQLVAPFLEAKPGMNVIDGCTGAGGKALHLAALMRDEGEILAVDIHEKKLNELEKRATRAGCKIIKSMLAGKLTQRFQKLLTSFADRILLDVPCSGLGILRRKPDAKWRLTQKYVNELKQTQATILDEYAPMLKQGGILVYSTCSILPSENEVQIKSFLERNKSYELLEEKRISPADTGFDGFYMAKMKRINLL